MIADRRARWTAGGALAAALLSLGLSTWAVGCRDRSGDSQPSPVLAASATAAAPIASGAVVEAAASVTPAPLPVPTIKNQPTKSVVSADALSVRRVVVTHAIENREPVPGTLKIGDQPVVAFLELASSAPVEQTVVVSFERGDRSVGHVKLRIPAESRRWRTWAQTRQIREPGQWQAVVRTEDGRELSRVSFEIVK